jgi:ATP-binding cassette subfamily B protein
MLMVLVAFAEILSIGAVLPFLGVLTAPSHVYSHPSAHLFIQLLDITSPNQLLLPITIAFSLAVLMAGAMRLMLLWVNTRLSFATGADLSISMYRRTLFQPYTVHLDRNSSEVIDGISNKASVVTNSMLMGANLISSCIAISAILMTLLAVNPVIALATFGGFGFIYSFTIWIARRRLLLNSQSIAEGSSQVIKSLQEGLSAIRDIILDRSQDSYCQIYRVADLKVRRASGDSTFVSTSPRYVVEALSMIFIAGIAYFLAKKSDGIASSIPLLGALALGGQRMLPMLQQIFSAWAGIKSNQISIEDAIELLEQPLPDDIVQFVNPLPYRHSISLQKISFRYSPDTLMVLNDLNLTISKGSRIGFIGSTGSGKSTLLDIIMGLLQPTGGTLAIDGQVITPNNCRAWQTHIAHVPQAIFLADSTIEENIAFGLPKDQIDLQRVRSAAQQAQIAEVIESWPQKYQTVVGERGVRLSGGQRQRIGIARALYKQADIIIFDEATSALDSDTEQAVMNAIDGLTEHLTILTIAHRLTTLKNCTQIIELGGGGITRTGTYEELIAEKNHEPATVADGQQLDYATNRREYK